jgi:hypothetical protein
LQLGIAETDDWLLFLVAKMDCLDHVYVFAWMHDNLAVPDLTWMLFDSSWLFLAAAFYHHHFLRGRAELANRIVPREGMAHRRGMVPGRADIEPDFSRMPMILIVAQPRWLMRGRPPQMEAVVGDVLAGWSLSELLLPRMAGGDGQWNDQVIRDIMSGLFDPAVERAD